MSRVVIVRQGSPVLEHESTERLHTYPSGDVLVRTDARAGEAGAGQEEPVEQGLRLGPAPASAPMAAPAAAPTLADDAAGLAYVELIGPLDPAWTKALREAGLTVLKHVPNHSFLCRGTGAAFAAAGALGFVGRVVPLTAEMKPGVRPTEAPGPVWIVALRGPGGAASGAMSGAAALRAELDALPGVELDANAAAEPADIYWRVKARIDARGQESLKAHPLVVAIEPFSPRVPEDELAGLVLAGRYDARGRPAGSYLAWLDEQGLDGAGVAIGVVDSGVKTDHPAFGGRARGGAGNGLGWHGTFVAGHAAGCLLDDKDPAGFIYGLGTAPAARIIAQDNARSAVELARETLGEVGRDGGTAAVQNNSWGAGLKDPMDYGSLEAQYDAVVRGGGMDPPRPLAVFFSSGNAGQSGLTRPKAAKNLIVTGNSEIYRPTVGKDESDSINEVYDGEHGSSWGNCGDGRVRPDVVAPGEWTSSAGFDVHPGEAEYINDRLTWGGGSSGASPKTCGAGALLIQWWRNHAGETPSPAMLRALIVNGAVDMDPAGGIPGRRQGWGRLNLADVLDDAVHRTYVDQTIRLTGRGEEATWTFQVSDPARPVRVTLCWTDPPGAVGSGTQGASALVNKLALRVEADGRRHLGNAFRNGWSDEPRAGHREGADNLQNVYLRPGAAGDAFKVTVAALDVTTNCLTNEAGDPKQDFALVVTNGHPSQDAAPADVFLVVDAASAASGPAAPREDGTATPGDTAAWDSPVLGAADGIAGGEGRTTPGATQAEWWAEDGVQWTTPETEKRDTATDEAARAALERGLAAAGDLVAAAQGSLTVGAAGAAMAPSTARAATARAATAHDVAARDAGDAEAHRRSAAAASEPPLEAQLAAAAAWVGAPPGAGRTEATRRSCVAVVGPRSRIGPEQIAALRRMAFLADLIVVSHDRRTLEWLAQRVHRRTGVSYRLAASAEDLGRAVRDGVGEALGGQTAAVKRVPGPGDAGDPAAARFSFLVVSRDRRLYVRLKHTGGAGLRDLRIFRPGDAKGYAVGPGTPPTGHRVRVEPGAAHIELDAPADGRTWAGEWQVAAAPAEGAAAGDITAAVWVWGGHRPRAKVAEAPASETPGGEAGFVLSLGGGDSKLAACTVLVMPPPERGEEKAKELRPLPRKLSRIAAAEETGRREELDAGAPAAGSPGSGVLSTVLRAKPPKSGAILQDVAVSAVGTTQDGERFARVMRLNTLRLEPRPVWRRRVARDGTPHLVEAEVVDVLRDGGRVVAVKLRRGQRVKAVAVDAPALGTTLARLDLKRPGLRFGVVGTRLLSVVVGLEPWSEDEPYGIEAPIPDLTAPDLAAPGLGTRGAEAAPAPEYPLASRYIQAKHFRRPASERAIRRVVVHITDGGRSIEGPIAWFKNPVKADGSPLPVSAHYIVGLDGEVVQMVRHADVAYHAGRANADSIGIEHCARPDRPGRPGIHPTPVQYAASAALVRWLCERHGIPMDRDHILGHAEADTATRHTGCPDAVWRWDRFMERVIEA